MMLKINLTTFKRNNTYNNVTHVNSLIFLDRLETPIPIEEFALSTPPPTTHSGKSFNNCQCLGSTFIEQRF